MATKQYREIKDLSGAIATYEEVGTGRFIPNDVANRDRRRINAEVAAGTAEILPAGP